MSSRSTARSAATLAGTAALAFAIGLLAPSVSRGQGEPAECASAAPSCFAGCRESQVRTAAGQCVPAAAPPGAPAASGVLVAALLPATAPAPVSSAAPAGPSSPAAAVPTAIPPAVPAAAATPSERACCHVALEVDAAGIKNLGDRAATTALHGDVRINGQLVGQTPFKDALPPGDYRVEVAGPAGEVHARVALLRPGKPQRLSARFGLALDVQELKLREAWRRGRAARARAEQQAARLRQQEDERAALLRRQAAEQARFERAHADWDERTAPLRAERARRQTIGFITGGSGLALAIAGSGLLVAAASAQDDAERAYERWRSEIDEDERPVWMAQVQDAQDERDLEHALGLSALGVGAAGIAVGCVFLLSTPDVEQEPQPPGRASLAAGRLALAPLLSPGAFGARARLRW